MYLFVHFGINTFTGNEWGDGTEDPSLFNPTGVDADQWVNVAQAAGFSGLILTAKHHDGFALWPTAYSDHSVENSPWMSGEGDVVKIVADAAQRAGLPFGIYLSLWDRHETTYGTPAFDDFFVGQLEELLTGYGPFFEIWLDGARNSDVTFVYNLERYYDVIRNLQPQALIANAGPDIRWAGNEEGILPTSVFSPLNESRWYPVECDVPNRPSWFWKAGESGKLKLVKQLVSIYFNCVGQNGALLLNVPADPNGNLPAGDIKQLFEFRAVLELIFEKKSGATRTRHSQRCTQRHDSLERPACNRR